MAKKSGLNKETIRYYERLQLIPEPPRTSSGYRIYSEDFIDRLHFIKRMQELGFTLKEIDQLLAVHDQDGVKCGNIHVFAREKLKDVQLKIRDLQRIEQVLRELLACGEAPQTSIYNCSIIGRFLGKSPNGDRGDSNECKVESTDRL